MVVRYTDLIDLLKQSPATEEFFRILVEDVTSKSTSRTKSLLYFSPGEQFIHLLESTPQIFQRVPQKHLAYYLGVAT